MALSLHNLLLTDSACSIPHRAQPMDTEGGGSNVEGANAAGAGAAADKPPASESGTCDMQFRLSCGALLSACAVLLPCVYDTQIIHWQ